MGWTNNKMYNDKKKRKTINTKVTTYWYSLTLPLPPPPPLVRVGVVEMGVTEVRGVPGMRAGVG